MLQDLAKCHTASATATALMLKNILDVLAAVSTHLSTISVYMAEIKTTRETFYKYSMRVFVVVFFAQLAIIGLLLKELNVEGADAVRKVGTSAVISVLK